MKVKEKAEDIDIRSRVGIIDMYKFIIETTEDDAEKLQASKALAKIDFEAAVDTLVDIARSTDRKRVSALKALYELLPEEKQGMIQPILVEKKK